MTRAKVTEACPIGRSTTEGVLVKSPPPSDVTDLDRQRWHLLHLWEEKVNLSGPVDRSSPPESERVIGGAYSMARRATNWERVCGNAT